MSAGDERELDGAQPLERAIQLTGEINKWPSSIANKTQSTSRARPLATLWSALERGARTPTGGRPSWQSNAVPLKTQHFCQSWRARAASKLAQQSNGTLLTLETGPILLPRSGRSLTRQPCAIPPFWLPRKPSGGFQRRAVVSWPEPGQARCECEKSSRHRSGAART